MTEGDSAVSGKPEVSSCDVDQFHCSNGKCIPDWWRCNSMDECGDNSDEELCVDSPFSFQPCSLNQFPCLSRYTRIYTCLPHSLRCDGSIDCQVPSRPHNLRSRTLRFDWQLLVKPLPSSVFSLFPGPR